MSKDRLKSPDWYAQMARVIEAIGTPSFVEALFAALNCLAQSQAITVFLYPRKGLPSALFENDEEGPWLPEGNVQKYLEGYYLLCPFYRACMDGIAPGCYRLSDVAPDHFKRSEYYLSFYQHAHLEDELNYIVPLDTQLTIAVALGNTRRLGAAQVADLKRVAPWVVAVVRRHWGQLDADSLGGRFESALGRQINAALNNFGSSLLTERECRVAQYLLRGHSTRSLAERLGISEDTVKTHRKNLYTKLDIAKQSELFSLFIDSLAQAQEGLSKDPLESYLRRR
ncbi:helix-turn-helix transcriptional regulator [Pseudomonas guariconensis]|uniref:helix-turn-helix transcriptional regulator n=1 Tax=Pseudomonas guariconensis TaxID=1288410 RepID=UPI0018AA94B2|nr:LuxR C-terminal-related transcriptional regulator [Pseudomonas guariconensis]MBF8724055.1 LuxR family transcriptional regulator [Pseudomonas guariconensis]MBF8743402.1 LuxR family transcriptional regulator [Pseudomonas guariconensis]MBF8752948.1 LuxR family transcriptional regulator [Pseudomonas guariconensis]MBF8793324.1 LuxR family transcriptional regulator [Pseudomonas monteilii]